MIKKSICAIVLAAMLPGLCACGGVRTAGETAEAEKTPAATKAPAEAEGQAYAGTYIAEKAVFPCVAVHVEANGLLYYIDVPQELADELNERIAHPQYVEGTELQWVDGWGDMPPQNVDSPALYYYPDEQQYYTMLRKGTEQWGFSMGVDKVADATEEIKALLELVSEDTHWDAFAGRPDLADITEAELIYNGETLLTVTNGERLNALEELLQNQTRGSYAPATPNFTAELRLTVADGSERSLLLDPDSPQIFLPPFYYYRYNQFEGSETKPMLDALALEQWPEQVSIGYDPNIGGWLSATMERLTPAPGDAEEFFHRQG